MRQATQAYQETVRLASMANSSNNPNIARQAYDTSQFAVNRANNVATGRLPNTYMPYDSNGNATSYYNSSRQTGKTPSPDAPRVEDVSSSDEYYCDVGNKDDNSLGITQEKVDLIKNSLAAFWYSLDVKAGLGQGLGGSFEIADVGVDLEISSNYIEGRLNDGKPEAGQSFKAEASIDAIFADFGARYTEYSDFNGNLLPELDESFVGYDLKIPSGVSVSLYFIVGGSFSVEVNYEKFIEKLRELETNKNE